MSFAGSGLFENYEQDYSTISTSISKRLNTQLPNLVGEQKKTMIRALERELDEADEIIQSMEMELNSLPPSGKTKFQSKFKNYKSDYDKLKSDFKKFQNSSNERAQLFGQNETFDMDSTSMDQRSRLLAGTGKLNDASRRLEESHRVALETEQIGAQTLQTLRNQRQQIERATDNLDEANNFIDRNVRILKSMARRMATNRMISIGIIIALIFIIGLILFVKFR